MCQFNCSPTHQEVQITLTMWVECSQSKEDIKAAFLNILPDLLDISIKEEAEIYDNEPSNIEP